MDKNTKIPLILKSLSQKEMGILASLDEFVIGQEFAKKTLISRSMNLNNGLRTAISGSKPPSTLLFIGPTGSGKMHFIKSFAKIFLGNENAFLRVNCAYFDESMIAQQIIDRFGFELHARSIYNKEITSANIEIEKIEKNISILEETLKKIITEGGSFGNCATHYNDEIRKLNKRQKDIEEKLDKKIKDIKWEPGGNYPAIVLFEGVDQMHHSVVNTLREILDSGTFMAKNGSVTSFKKCFIFLTCNLLSEDLVKDFIGEGAMGYDTKTKKDSSEKIAFYERATKKVAKMIPLELLKEIGKENIVVFRPSSKKEMMGIIDKKLGYLNPIYLGGDDKVVNIVFTEKLKKYIYKETQDSINIILGAAPIDRIISLRICNRLGKILENEEFGIVPGDTIEVDFSTEEEEIIFSKIVAV